MTTALGFRFLNPGSWLRSLDRWLAIWSIDDQHPAVADAALKPSELRAIYGENLGIDVPSWLAGVWLVCSRWWLSLDGTCPIGPPPDGVFRLPLDGDVIEAGDSFRSAFCRHLSGTIAEFRSQAVREAGDAYSGLGSLNQGDSIACRNVPVIELDDGALVPLSLELLADRATLLHRQLLGGRTQAAGAVGSLFEAHVTNVLERLRSRHIVVTEGELKAASPTGQRCDGLIADAGAYVAVEAAIQSLSRRIALGDLSAIATIAERYQHEADQAFATIGRLPELASLLGTPSPTNAVPLVVTETTVPQNPAFQWALRRLRPGRTAKFVCSVADLELLVGLGLAGWSVPAAVASWQSKAEEVPLDVHLHDMARTLPPREAWWHDLSTWLDLVPRRGRSAA
jgi:hypothetical protein